MDDFLIAIGCTVQGKKMFGADTLPVAICHEKIGFNFYRRFLCK